MAQFLLVPLPWSRESNDYQKENKSKNQIQKGKQWQTPFKIHNWQLWINCPLSCPLNCPKCALKPSPNHPFFPPWDLRTLVQFPPASGLVPRLEPRMLDTCTSNSNIQILSCCCPWNLHPGRLTWNIMEPTNHPFGKENDLPTLHDYVLC